MLLRPGGRGETQYAKGQGETEKELAHGVS
jgi:hypothetical protein